MSWSDSSNWRVGRCVRSNSPVRRFRLHSNSPVPRARSNSPVQRARSNSPVRQVGRGVRSNSLVQRFGLIQLAERASWTARSTP
ncbi:hypothetical protein F2Q70_00038615 [Brassica cretica]|uniref:Uncharacterized protein n=1 Tax=Brassica cretica TaxID=69181 RepID=A0A8S9K8B5_BRACR|nr:hypothetical protein F2Q70_00038615 [Brassica cretica]KAF2619723.1 hypothetical protein F2Q68_00039258 [Brassica cretica]